MHLNFIKDDKPYGDAADSATDSTFLMLLKNLSSTSLDCPLIWSKFESCRSPRNQCILLQLAVILTTLAIHLLMHSDYLIKLSASEASQESACTNFRT